MKIPPVTEWEDRAWPLLAAVYAFAFGFLFYDCLFR